MAQSEMNFLFNTITINNDNKGEIYVINPTADVLNTTDINNTKYRYNKDFVGPDKDGKISEKYARLSPVAYKNNYSTGTASIKNQYKGEIYYNDTVDTNPYLIIMKKFSSSPSVKILSSDLAYCKDLGVYPVNKMFILRRFAEGVSVPINLLEPKFWKNKPVSVIVGWIKSEKSPSDLFSFGFSEGWSTTDQYLNDVFLGMIKNETGIDIQGAMSAVPGSRWSSALLFGFLKGTGLLSPDFSEQNMPYGDPNLLDRGPIREGVTPDETGIGASMSLKSTFSLPLEVIYEQKFIGDVDPGLAFHDIINNVLHMGTSDIKYLGNPSGKLYELMINAASKGTDSDAWVEVFSALLEAFLSGVTSAIEAMGDSLDSILGGKSDNESKEDVINNGSSSNFISESIKNMKDKASVLIETYLAQTVQKYKWPLLGSTAAMTGLAVTPWHLTVGNPLMPILSMNNIKLESCELHVSSEMGFNDIPKEITFKCTVTQARDFGAQEIFKFFNNGYDRTYSIPQNANNNKNTTSSKEPNELTRSATGNNNFNTNNSDGLTRLITGNSNFSNG